VRDHAETLTNWYVRRSRDRFWAGETERAELGLRETLALNPMEPLALAHLGWLSEMRGNWPEAMQHYERLLASGALANQLTPFHVSLASLHLRHAAFEHVIRVLEPFRPEGVLVSRSDQPGYRPAEAHLVQPFGGFDIVDLKVGNRIIRARTAAGYVGRAGDAVWTRLDPAHAHFFDNRSGSSLDIRLGD
jgi:hypothetical protein